MKTFMSKSKIQDSGHAIRNRQSRRRMSAEFSDNRTESAVQQKMVHTIKNGSVRPVQMKFIESDPAQGKFLIQRQLDEDELMQGKFLIQRQPDEEELMQGKFLLQRQSEPEEEELQGKFEKSAKPVQKAANATGIQEPAIKKMEKSFNTDFSDVNIHPNSSKATDMDALAYTQGSDIHFAPGQFKPDSSEGKQLLGHELAHVVQQRQGRVQPTTQINGMPVNDNPALEKEADNLGSKN